MVDKALFSSETTEWETPQELFNELNSEFHFDVDVCATAKNKKCESYLDVQADGLKQPWCLWDACWCNPPYGRAINLWIEKAAYEAKQGATVVMLLPARTDTRYFHDCIWDCEKHRTRPGVELRLLRGRLKFIGAENSAPFPSMVVVFRPILGGHDEL